MSQGGRGSSVDADSDREQFDFSNNIGISVVAPCLL